MIEREIFLIRKKEAVRLMRTAFCVQRGKRAKSAMAAAQIGEPRSLIGFIFTNLLIFLFTK